MQLGVESIQRITLARELIVRGYVNKIIEIEAGLGTKTLNRLRASLKTEGLTWSPPPRGTRQAQTIIKKVAHRQEFSIIMLAYRRYGGDSIFKAVDVSALNKAYDTYRLIKHEFSPHTELANINDCYTLAVDVRSADAEFEHCHDCNVPFFVSFSQESSYRCPFCLNREAAHRHQHSSAA
tara:strand:+ start:2406 stop:2945 length:540 start_codon:yes stop_codon:yes gene_type:complete